MKNRNQIIIPVILCFTFAVGALLSAMTPAANANTPETLEPVLLDSSKITIASLTPPIDSGSDNAISIMIDGRILAMSSPALLIDSTTYVPLYDFCRIVGPTTITQDGDVTIVSLAGLVIEASPDNYYIKANGRYLYTPTLCKVIDNVMYVPIRSLMKAHGTAATWEPSSRTVYVSTPFTPIESGDSFYNQTDLYWMSRIISAEARGECADGRIAVGNVVMNRVRASVFPNTVHGVIFDRRSGIQFSPAYSGSIYRTPNQECIIAAKLALDDADVVGNSMYFNMARRSSWASRNRVYVTTIGNHDFYA